LTVDFLGIQLSITPKQEKARYTLSVQQGANLALVPLSRIRMHHAKSVNALLYSQESKYRYDLPDY